MQAPNSPQPLSLCFLSAPFFPSHVESFQANHGRTGSICPISSRMRSVPSTNERRL